jgi:hypothetical protein
MCFGAVVYLGVMLLIGFDVKLLFDEVAMIVCCVVLKK